MSSSTEILAQLVARHPWLEVELRETAAFTYAQRWTLPVPIEAAWKALSDTSRLNRAIKIPTATFTEKQGRRHGQSVYFGRPFTWREPPWEWAAPHVFTARKHFDNGPVGAMFSVVSLEEEGETTQVTLWYGWYPRGMLGGFATRRVVNYLEKNFNQVMPELIRSLKERTASPLIRPPRSVPPGAQVRIDAVRKEMIARGVLPEVAARLTAHVLESDPMDLDRLRPYALASAWEQGRSEVLGAFLEATRAGLTLARWDVICPHCRGVRDTLERLDELGSTAQCEACAVHFETGSSTLELAFRVHPSIRTIEKRLYCAAEPAMKPHIRMQLTNEVTTTVRGPLQEGAYLVRSGDFEIRVRLEVTADGPPSVHLPDQTEVGVGGSLTLPEGRWVMEQIAGVHDAVQPRHVLSLEAYRAVMGTEVLASDLALEIGVQTLLFTDVVGSTKLYTTLGDRAAFEAVRTHFEVIRTHVQTEGGAVIKTIGDAVMAAFTTPEAAARAARAIATSDLGLIRVRLSMHTGSCIAVNLDTGLDYFGSVVNEAAKLQGAAGSGEVALTETLAEELGLEGREATYVCGAEERRALVWTPWGKETPVMLKAATTAPTSS